MLRNWSRGYFNLIEVRRSVDRRIVAISRRMTSIREVAQKLHAESNMQTDL